MVLVSSAERGWDGSRLKLVLPAHPRCLGPEELHAGMGRLLELFPLRGRTGKPETCTGLYWAINEVFDQASIQVTFCLVMGSQLHRAKDKHTVLLSGCLWSHRDTVPRLLGSLQERNDLACLSLNLFLHQIMKMKMVITSQDGGDSHVSQHMSTIPPCSLRGS